MSRATFTIHDQPSILLDHAREKELLDAAYDHKSELHFALLLARADAPQSPHTRMKTTGLSRIGTRLVRRIVL